MLGSAGGALLAPVLLRVVGLAGALAVVGALPGLWALLRHRALGALDSSGLEREGVVRLISSSSLFRGASPYTVSALVSAAERVTVRAGSTLMAQGDVGDSVALIAEGTADVDTDGRHVATLGPGRHVGEIALLYDVPRTATVRAQTNVVAWRIGQEAFLSAVTSVPGGRLPTSAVPRSVHEGPE
jgi:hypothetical protein